jgi:hypothetical protein
LQLFVGGQQFFLGGSKFFEGGLMILDEISEFFPGPRQFLPRWRVDSPAPFEVVRSAGFGRWLGGCLGWMGMTKRDQVVAFG